MAMELVREACDPAKKADVWAVVMQEGLANLAVLTGARTVLRQRVEVAVPKKRGFGAGDHDQVSLGGGRNGGRPRGRWGTAGCCEGRAFSGKRGRMEERDG